MGKRAKWRVVAVAGAFRPGEPLDHAVRDTIRLPAELVDTGELVYRVQERGIPLMNIRRGDYLVIKARARQRVSSGETVLAKANGRAYLGRWWATSERRAVLDETGEPIVEDAGLRVIGVLTTTVRLEGSGDGSSSSGLPDRDRIRRIDVNRPPTGYFAARFI